MHGPRELQQGFRNVSSSDLRSLVKEPSRKSSQWWRASPAGWMGRWQWIACMDCQADHLSTHVAGKLAPDFTLLPWKQWNLCTVARLGKLPPSCPQHNLKLLNIYCSSRLLALEFQSVPQWCQVITTYASAAASGA